MRFLELPLYQDIYYTYSIGLETSKYVFTFLWNDRAKSWHMDIRKEDQTPVVLGIKMVSSFPLMADYTLEDHDITGYFVLMPKTREMGILSDNPNNMAQYYRLYYVYE